MERRRPGLGCLLAIIFSAGVWALLASVVFASTWRDAPPERYQRDAFVYVEYVPYEAIPTTCNLPRRDLAGCAIGSRIVLPAECSPTRRPMARWERIVIADLTRSYCDRLRLHEIGHVNGWGADHPH